MNLLDLDLLELRSKIEKREVTSRQLVEAYLENIAENEENINAYISIVDRDKALAKADEIDQKLERKEEVGLLAGIPISVKDNIITKDFKTTAGSKMLENFQAPYDASVIEKIKAEDGIILGKTNMDEFAMGNTSEKSYFGPSKNPLDLDLVPGGSSGGSAASIAGREALISIVSDTGGSARQPASYCGIVGFKPSYGNISRYGLIPVSNTLDSVGIMARRVLDIVFTYNIISGLDKKDPTSLKTSKMGINDIKDGASVDGLKIALPKQFILEDANRENKTELSKAIKDLEDMGARVEEVDLPSLEYLYETYTIISSGDISSNMSRFDGIRFGYRADEYESLDELYMNTRSQAFGEEVKKRILFGSYLLSGNRGREYYDRALKVRRVIYDEINKLYEDYDLILSLTSSMKANKLGDIRNTSLSKSEAKFNILANLVGLCAISVPSRDNKQIGIQFMANRGMEETLFKSALAYERMVE